MNDKVEAIDEKISSYAASKNVQLISKHVQEMQFQGKFDIVKMWKQAGAELGQAQYKIC